MMSYRVSDSVSFTSASSYEQSTATTFNGSYSCESTTENDESSRSSVCGQTFGPIVNYHIEALKAPFSQTSVDPRVTEIDTPLTTESAEPNMNLTKEPVIMWKLAQDLKKSGLARNHRKGLFGVRPSTFSGKEFVDWIVAQRHIDRQRAVQLGQQLLDDHYCHDVTMNLTFRDHTGSYYRLLEHSPSSALNAGEAAISAGEPQPASKLGENLRKNILKLYGTFLSEDGKKVDYMGMKGSEEFQAYMDMAKELQLVKIAGASREEKLAFFINVYNALVIHANVVRGSPTNLWQRYWFFNTVKYIIGGYEYSLQDIENGVLRANRKGVGMFSPPFKIGDPRLRVALERHEPLIHFALVCGAKSCPPINCYKAEVALWVHDHMADDETKEQLGELLSSGKFKVAFMKYDWSVNSKS